MSNRQATAHSNPELKKTAVGVGLRSEHYQNVLEQTPALDFLEVHSENFFADAGIAVDLLQEVSASTPISLHGTSAGLGSVEAVPDDYLKKLKRLVDRVDPILVSDHLCFTWARIGGRLFHGGDLLPIPFTEDSLRHAVNNIDRIQQYLGRQIAIENVCAYIEYDQSDFDEASFLGEIVARTQCGLILDINNLMVNARNGQVSNLENFVDRYVESLDYSAITEIHLAGSTPVGDEELLIDDHARPVSEAGWQIYQRVLNAVGPRPTLIEWDNNLPSWRELLGEASKARKAQRQVLRRERSL
ncbi:DUF692 domain-containing protein [Marinobacter salinexigens]|jgi:uncharacterized protein|uniref:DUF692 domain-containing protein n=1 Tax=Marinobacter salinexigens TaxID=2919747 RepID=A0A5B0VG89_9GAMM|nr:MULTISPECIES: DUF692 domain-containing protein [Marinobacter]KAA1173283.1 DUF692 domain-containing protein [Marinobacter salinexigens]